MRLYSMTATFGKLEHDTLTLQPGMNILEAPNEWGKSTWCAFLVAMLYGMETRARTTKSVLADKERYTPWSGSPMSGSIELCWQGRDITIQRRTKGRVPLGEFRAYETHTGLAVPELTAANCGQLLLGVEKSVFQQSAFIRFDDLPVAGDENLRRRLNALVTTGDESGTAELLGQKLRELKNRCRANKNSGLLPQAQADCAQLEQKLHTLHDLQNQFSELTRKQTDLEQQQAALQNHRAALKYAESRDNAERLSQAEAAWQAAHEREVQLTSACMGIASCEVLDGRLDQLQQLRARQDALHTELRKLTAPPVQESFAEHSSEDAVRDLKSFGTAGAKRTGFMLAGLLCLVIGLCGLLFFQSPVRYIGIVPMILTVICMILSMIQQFRRSELLKKYHPLPPEEWVEEAERCRHSRLAREEYLQRRRVLEARMQTLEQEIRAYTDGMSIPAYELQLRQQRERWGALEEARRESRSAQALEQMLRAACRPVDAPSAPDLLDCSAAETEERLSACAVQLQQLHRLLGSCQAQMTALGQEEDLRLQLDAAKSRVGTLEETLAAVELAQTTLTAATEQLQRRFAPKIAKRAQALFQKLTGKRYDRIVLEADLRLSTSAREEDTLRASLWRSDGTVDQLYLALRLAVAKELIPHAPLILDDALVRFDDTRLAAAMEILREEAQERQVILFTCQGREQTV